ncbi:MAG: hypothetical protein EOP06_26180 [Proteobacteria bacterium]|nr:MAG: hypothetical protein EOP06_26180 [Pseudomonadota bacterium]
MTSSRMISFLMPAEKAEQEVTRRFRQVGMEFLSLDASKSEKLSSCLKIFVRDKIRKARIETITESLACRRMHKNLCSCIKKSTGSEKSTENLFDSSFSERHILPLLASRRRGEKATAKHVGELVDKLQRAATYCALATFPSAKPLRTLLDEVSLSCREFDELEVSHNLQKRRVFENRARGGRARQRIYRVLDRLAIYLLGALVPEGGWNNMTHAAEVIATRLEEVIVRFKLKVTLQLDARIRKVITLIREIPRARNAYERHRASRRTYRRNVR